MEVILHVKKLDIHTQLCVQGQQRTDVQRQGVGDETVKAEVTPMSDVSQIPEFQLRWRRERTQPDSLKGSLEFYLQISAPVSFC